MQAFEEIGFKLIQLRLGFDFLKYIEENGYELVSGGFEQIPNVELKEVTPEQRSTLEKLTGLLEDDEDVTNVYSTMKPE